MTFAFARTLHDRVAHLRAHDWLTPDVRVMVIGGEHVATDDGSAIRWLTPGDAPEGEFAFLGELDGTRYAAMMVDRVPSDLEPVSLRMLGPAISGAEASLAVHAAGLSRWHQTNTHCARCGQLTRVGAGGHTRRCVGCEAEHFPRTDPAVIMLITDQRDRALLGRQASWPAGRYSTLAGFVEPGEALEDAVRREVAEEVGVDVGEVSYAGSQPWPFPSSLMIGFFGIATTDSIAVDGDEIVEARWFTRHQLSEAATHGDIAIPPEASISRWLIDTWHGGHIDGDWRTAGRQTEGFRPSGPAESGSG